TLRNGAVLGARLLLGRALLLKARAGAGELLVDLLPDRVELLFDQAGWQVDLVHLIQAIKELPLDALARGLIVSGLELLANRVAQRGEVLDAEADRELVVDRDFVAAGYVFHLDCKLC